MCEEKIKTTAEHFETFKAACFRWRERLGLHWIELMFVHLDDGNALATTQYSGVATWGTIRLSKTWDSPRPLTDATLDGLARHEVMHLLTAEFNHLATDRYTSETEINNAEERLVRRIEALFERGQLTCLSAVSAVQE